VLAAIIWTCKFGYTFNRFNAVSRATSKKTLFGTSVPPQITISGFNVKIRFDRPMPEIRMIRILGADAVGMSTVPEALVAVHGKMKVVGISCLTNMACGILDQPLSHDEVIEVAALVRDKFLKLVKESIARM
jgi:Phosphorylase superfamily